MDIKTSVLLWATSTFAVNGRNYLKCNQFFDGSPFGGTLSVRDFTGHLRCLSETSEIEVAGKLSVDHLQGLSKCVRVESEEFLKFPCLMTDCHDLHCIFHGPVSVTYSHEKDTKEVIAEGLPLVSAKWLGFVKCIGDDAFLTAFGVKEGSPADTSAFCPWWAESTAEPDAHMFHIHA